MRILHHTPRTISRDDLRAYYLFSKYIRDHFGENVKVSIASDEKTKKYERALRSVRSKIEKYDHPKKNLILSIIHHALGDKSNIVIVDEDLSQ